jgi:hypothetical protein
MDQEGDRGAALPAWMPYDQPGVGVMKVTLRQADGLRAIPVVPTPGHGCWCRRLRSKEDTYTYGSPPACAGTAVVHRYGGITTAVHPRVRGDGHQYLVPTTYADGSPPRARGRRGHHRSKPPTKRFTPACAGTAGGKARPCGRASVHPRVRGDGSPPTTTRDPLSGSPPRARGRPRRSPRRMKA